MNIATQIDFNLGKPHVVPIKKTEKLNVFAVGITEGDALKKHKSSTTALLTVLQGSVDFEIEGEVHMLNQFDVFDIPVGIEHEVRAVVDSIVLLSKEI